MIEYTHEHFMKEALKEARKAMADDEVPVGGVVVCNNLVIARAYNMTERLNDVTAHAEMQAITAAANYLGSKYLNDCTLYVTLEPCTMCAGASYWAQMGMIVYGAKDEKRGYTNVDPDILHPGTIVISGILAEECKTLLNDFFNLKR